MSALEQILAVSALGVVAVFAMLVAIRRAASALASASDGGTSLRMGREQLDRLNAQHRAQLLRIAGAVGDPRLLTKVLRSSEDTRVLYSPEAEEQLALLGVSREHVETVLAYPGRTIRRRKDSSMLLRRDFGNHTLSVVVADPWPSFGTIYIRRVARDAPQRRAFLGILDHHLGGCWRRLTARPRRTS